MLFMCGVAAPCRASRSLVSLIGTVMLCIKLSTKKRAAVSKGTLLKTVFSTVCTVFCDHFDVEKTLADYHY